MKYRVSCLTPTLVGDGRRLSPIDYMVWKDQINVLDQTRIFKLLSKGPRLEGYLKQLRTADKLDFASWGGFAQNYADRRVPFESAAYSAYWNRAVGEMLFIPTFAAGPAGPYLPAAAIKGALRTAVLFTELREGAIKGMAEKSKGDRPSRRPAAEAEQRASLDRMRLAGAADSLPIDYSAFKVYLLRTSTLQPRGAGKPALGWKQSPRGAADGAKPAEGTPSFAEMAPPGTTFEGHWHEKEFFAQPAIRQALRWPASFGREAIFNAANQHAGAILAAQKQYASAAGLDLVVQSVSALEGKLEEARAAGACLLCIGWGGGLLGKSAWLDTENADYRQILQGLSLYGNALRSGLPFPKTRRIVFLNDKPATLSGWVSLQVEA